MLLETCDIWYTDIIQFWQLRTWIHDNLCCLTIKSGQHLKFLRCFAVLKFLQSLRGLQRWPGWTSSPALVAFAAFSLGSALYLLLNFFTGSQSGFARTFKTWIKQDPVTVSFQERDDTSVCSLSIGIAHIRMFMTFANSFGSVVNTFREHQEHTQRTLRPPSRVAECQSFYTEQNLQAKLYPKKRAYILIQEFLIHGVLWRYLEYIHFFLI